MPKSIKAKEQVFAPLKFSKNDIINDVIGKFPAAIEILLSYGLNCVSCSLNSADSIEVGAKAHGIEVEKIKEIMQAINRASVKYAKEMLSAIDLFMSLKAEQAILKVAEEENKSLQPLRIEVQGDCCQDTQYVLDFDKQKSTDIEYKFPHVTIIATPTDAKKIGGCIIDYLDGPMGTGFKIDNPQMTECKCESN